MTFNNHKIGEKARHVLVDGKQTITFCNDDKN